MNKRSAERIVAALAVISLVVTAILWLQLRKERQFAASLRMSPAQPAPAARDAATMPDDAPAPAPVVEIPVQPPEKPSPAPLQPAPVDMIRNAALIEQQLLNDPEYRKDRITVMRASIMRSYPGLADALNLTREDADRFFDVMAETQLDIMSLARTVATSDTAAGDLAGSRRALLRRQGESLMQLLGPVKYEQWLSYQPTRSSRMQASNMGSMLVEAGVPLDSAQVKSLEQAVAEEEKRLMHDIVAIGRTVDPLNPQPQTQAQAQEALKSRQAESPRRILDTAAPSLTPRQAEILRTRIAEQDALQNAIDSARRRARELQAQPGG